MRVGRNLVVVAGVGPTSGTDTYLVFDADLKQYLGSVDGVYQGSGSIQGLVYNPIRKVLLGLAANAKLVIDPLKAPVLGSYLSLGVSLGAVNIGVCLVTKDYLAVFVDGSTTACVLHRLDTYAFYAQITLAAAPQQGAQAFYDNDRNRIVCVNPTAGSPLSLTIIDVATATASTTTVIQATDADTSPAVSFAAKGGVYQGGKYVIGANGPTPNGTTLFVIDPTTLLAQKTYTYEAYAALQLTADLLSPVSPRSYVYSFDATQVKRLYYKPSSLGGQPLSEVVADLSQRATLTAGQLDVSALTDTVNGYAIARQTTVRAAIDALRPAYYFDAVERDAKVVYVKRGGAIVVTVPDTDLAAGEGKAASDDLLRTRQMEVELPHTLNVTYLSAATDYSAAAKLSRRLIGKSVNEATLGLPLVLSDATAQAIADANMHVAYVQRLSFQFALPRKYSYLEPTDIVVVKGHTLLITKISASPGGVLKVEAVADDANFYTPNAIVTETPTSGKLVYVPSPSRLELM